MPDSSPPARFLLFTVFLTGAAVLIIEVTATRLLAPYFGNTIYSLSSVLTVILGALSAGYYLGGRLADRFPHTRYFYSVIAVSGLALLLTKVLSTIILPLLSAVLGLDTGPLLASLLLFTLPAALLGTLSPYAIRLIHSSASASGVGSISGTVYFVSTLGSIAGSLGTGFFLIPLFGLDRIITATALGLVFLGIWGLKFRPAVQITLLFIAALILSRVFHNPPSPYPNTIFSMDGLYQKIYIVENNSRNPTARYLIQDRNFSAGIYLNSTDHVFEYTRYFSLYRVFMPRAKNILAVGGGGYTTPRHFLAEIPDARVDVAEIEPFLYPLSLKYLNLSPDARLNNFTTDARLFLRQADKPYDIIFADAYSSLLSIPVHLASREFFQLARDHLSPDGLFIGNFIGSFTPVKNSYLLSQIKTFINVFPNTYLFVHYPDRLDMSQNVIFLGLNSQDKPDLKTLLTRTPLLAVSDPLSHYIDPSKLKLDHYPVFTDNYNPSEHFLAGDLRDSYTLHLK